jgi:hypothetical protein
LKLGAATLSPISLLSASLRPAPYVKSPAGIRRPQ